MRTGLSIYSLWNALRKGEMTVEEAFAFMQALGCESTEIANFVVPLHTPDHQYIPEMAIKLREYSDKYEVPIGAYSCGSDIGRAEGPMLEGMKHYVFSEIDLAHLLGAPLIRIDLVRVMVGKDDTGIEAFDRIFERCVNVAREMADYAAQYGIMLTVENHGTLMNGADRYTWSDLPEKILILTCSISVSLFVFNIVKDWKPLRPIGKDSLFYYMYHMFIISMVFIPLVRNHGWPSTFPFIVLYTAITLAILIGMSKIPLFRWLLHPTFKKRPRKNKASD